MEALSHEVDRLHLRDRVALQSNECKIKGAYLRLVRHSILIYIYIYVYTPHHMGRQKFDVVVKCDVDLVCVPTVPSTYTVE